MANNCINIKSVEFQTNLKRSGLSEFAYAVEVQSYFDKQRRMGVSEDDLKYPELDMIETADSAQFLSEGIKLKDDGASIQDIITYAKVSSLEEAIIEINNKHRDLEVSVLPLNEQALVQVEHRPTAIKDKANPRTNILREKRALIPIFNKLGTLYGIKFNNVTIADIDNDPKFKDVVDAKHTNAFILNGEVYINMDVADIDAPIHELSHLLLGSIKFQNPSLYSDLVNIVEMLPDYGERVKLFPSRTRSDVNEEIFVTELAKFIANQNSAIQELPEYIQEEILYNVKRLLDSMLMGDVSVRTVPTTTLTSMSLFDIAELVNSDVFDNVSRGSLSDGQIHRMLNNRKSDLINNNELKEECL